MRKFEFCFLAVLGLLPSQARSAVPLPVPKADQPIAELNAEGSHEPLPVLDWSMEKISQNPDAYFTAAIVAMEREMDRYRKEADELSVSVDELLRQITEKQKLYENTRQLLDIFREHYQRAMQCDKWPVEVCGRTYTKERLESQVSRLLAQAKVFREAVTELRQGLDRAEGELHSLVTRPTQLEVKITLANLIRRLHIARQIPSVGEQQLAKLQEFVGPPSPEDPEYFVALLDAVRLPLPDPSASSRRLRTSVAFLTDDSRSRKQQARRRKSPVFIQK